MVSNAKLHRAKHEKNDEFYTQYSDVEAELANYGRHFSGKAVYCNCDDPGQSAFWKYFHLNFDRLGLKKLVATHYRAGGGTYRMDYEGGDDGDMSTGAAMLLNGDGDFRSPECLDALDECDIVVTNPPFSLFREYVRTLVSYKKKFLVIGNMNCVTYKEIFPLIRDNEMWLGTNARGGTRKGNTMWFGVPDNIEAKDFILGRDGTRLVQVSAWWFTNLDHAKRHEPLELSMEYSSDEYPRYDNYDAIEVGRTAGIPMDYDGAMGVPISFLDKYGPEQFEIVGTTESEGKGLSNGLFLDCSIVSQPLVNGRRVYKRVFIRRKP